ncbi:hypothetical protein ACFQ9X_30090 [Catenulispora yoronensis]
MEVRDDSRDRRLGQSRQSDPEGPARPRRRREPRRRRRSRSPEPEDPAARRVDFDDPQSLPGAFAGVDVLLVVSAGYAEDDVVLARHGAVADAAAARVSNI